MKLNRSSLWFGLGLLLIAGLAQPQMVKKAKAPAGPAAQPQPPAPVYQPPSAPAGPVVESSTKAYPTQCPPADQRISIAAYPIKPAGAPPELATAMTALLASQLTPSPKLKVIEEGMLKTVMERQAMNASDACDDTSCQVEIGKLVKAQKLVTGDLSKFGSKYILSLKLIDIQTGATEFATEDKCSCPEDQLDLLVSTAAAEVRNHFCEALALPSAAQAVAVPVSQPAATLPGSATVYLLHQQNACLGKGSFSLDDAKFKLREAECAKKVVPSGNRTIRDEYTKFALPYQAQPGGSYYFEATGSCGGAMMKNGGRTLTQLPPTPPPAWAAICPDFSQLQNAK